MSNNDDSFRSARDIVNDPSFAMYFNKKFSFMAAYEGAATYFQKLDVIRDFYRLNENDIISYNRKWPNRFCLGVYPIDWPGFFSPIEMDAWCSIRSKGIVMYPQYPVLKYFVDFGNPVLKIAIEVDGKKFHDKKKDAIRDLELLGVGWKVFRIPGSQMWNSHYIAWSDVGSACDLTREELDGLVFWMTRTGDGVIEAIAEEYFRGGLDETAYPYELCQAHHQTLQEHCLVQ